jgi:hypothetical protein
MKESGENKKKQRNNPKALGKSHDPLGNPFPHLKETITALET